MLPFVHSFLYNWAEQPFLYSRDIISLHLSGIWINVYHYFHIFIFLYYRQVLTYRRNTKKLEKQLSRNSKIVIRKQSNNRFKLFVPTLIIVTFLLFMIAPNTLRSFAALKLLDGDVSYKISYFLIPIGFIADPIIYIFSLMAIWLTFARILRFNNSVHTIESS